MILTLSIILTVGLCLVGCAEINSNAYTTSSPVSAKPIDESVLLLQLHLCRDVCYKEVMVFLCLWNVLDIYYSLLRVPCDCFSFSIV